MSEVEDDDFDMDAFIEAIGLGEEPPSIKIKGGKELRIKKATAAQLFLILELLKSIAVNMNIQSFDNMGDLLTAIDKPVDFLSLLSGSVDRMLQLVASLCANDEIDTESVERMELDDLLLLAWAEWKVNEHFFTNRLLPMIQKLGTGQESEMQTESLDEHGQFLAIES